MLIPSHNTLCTRLPERAKTSIPSTSLRSYKERPHHLCKVMRAFLPRAQERSYLEREDIHRMPIVRAPVRPLRLGFLGSYWTYSTYSTY